MKNKLQKCRFSNLKSITTKVFLTIAVLSSSQQLFAQFTDDFSDGDFVSDPLWSGSDSNFIVEATRLNLKAPPVADAAYLATASTSINDATWEFSVQLDFNPSTSNFTRVYLVSDQPNLSGPLNGYFVELGNTSDDVSLYRQTGTNVSRLIDGTDGKTDLAQVSFRIKVHRDRDGLWDLYTDSEGVGSYILEGSASDTQHLKARYFGVYCNYTSTRSDKFHFDDFAVKGEGISDQIPKVPVNFKDIIFTEVFADPSPTIGLPDVEFVEILNVSNNTFNLDGLTLSDGSSTMTLPEIPIAPEEYVIITSNSSLFSENVKSIGSDDFPSLNNSGDRLILADASGNAIDSVHYSIDWYRDNKKKEGGWSLELIDPNNKCAERENWTASEHPSGGTPGVKNSVLASKPDVTGPLLSAAIPLSRVSVRVIFNEKLQHELPSPDVFVIEPNIGVKSISNVGMPYSDLKIELLDELAAGVTYRLSVTSIFDCTGNAISESSNQVTFGLPEDPLPNDVLINEILFDPRPAGVDFIEIVNASEKFFNLKGWYIANFENDTITRASLISSDDILLPPRGYLALTEDPDVLMSDYPSAFERNIFKVDDLPAFNDDAGSVALSGRSMLLDHFSYSKSLHSVFIDDPEGVSLERIALTGFTNDNQNWKSASTLSGYATPGYLNSNSRSDPVSAKTIEVEPEVFVPIYGQPDFVLIHYEFDRGGYIANVRVLDAQGHHVKQLGANDILGTTGTYRWDGDNDDGGKARVGYYIVSFEVFDDAGDVKTFFSRVVVATRF